MTKGTLTKLSQNDNALRTNSISGEYTNPPTVGARFYIMGAALDSDAREDGWVRRVDTSEVVEVEEKHHGCEFKTESGTLYNIDTGGEI